MSANSGDGTDHGWGGINFMLGGSVKGGKIFGSYPADLTVNNELDVGERLMDEFDLDISLTSNCLSNIDLTGRGRFIPTMPFEAPWNAVSQWLGIEEEYELEKILPNRKSFPDMLLESTETFVDEELVFQEEHCEDDGTVVSCTPTEFVEDDDYYFGDDSTEDGDDDYDNIVDGAKKSSIIIATTITILLVLFGLIAASFYFRSKSNQKYKHFDDSSDKDNTFDLGDSSFEEQVQSLNLFHYKNEDGVEIAARDSLKSSK